MARVKIKEIIEASSGMGDNAVLSKVLNALENRIDSLEESIDKDPPEDSRVEKISLKLASKLATLEKGDDGHTPTDEELIALIDPLIPKLTQPEDGHTPTNEELLALIKPLIPVVKDGETPSDERLTSLIDSIMAKRMEEMHPKMVAEMEAIMTAKIPQMETAEVVRDKLESLQGDERLDKSAIKGLDEELKKIAETKSSAMNYGISGGAKGRVHYYDLTSQCNGVLKTFAVPLNFGIIGVFSTQFPINYRPIIDWTAGNKTLTLTSAVSAPDTGQTLWIAYIK